MITLTLLHPHQPIPVKSWTFENESVIRVGRSAENHVVLYSAVVSRRHLELRRHGCKWNVVNLGTNGTYLDDRPIDQISAVDGLTIRLARSGPKLQIHFTEAPKPQAPAKEMLRNLLDRANISTDEPDEDTTSPHPTKVQPNREKKPTDRVKSVSARSPS